MFWYNDRGFLKLCCHKIIYEFNSWILINIILINIININVIFMNLIHEYYMNFNKAKQVICLTSFTIIS